MDHRVTLVLGASPNPWRYSHMAVTRLLANGHAVLAVGRRKGDAGGVPIQEEIFPGTRIDTVTIYLNATNQLPWTDRLLALHPHRLIYNPGAEHPAFARRAESAGIEVVEGCTLVMLAAGTY